MFDLFGIKARRKAKQEKENEEKARIEAEKLALAKENKAKYQERKSKIEKYLADYDKKIRDIAFSEFIEESKEAEKENTTCPICGSHNVINKITRAKGELHGEGSSISDACSAGSSGLFTSSHSSYFYSHGSSKIDGKLDTYPINKCNECGNEWYIKKVKHKGIVNDFDEYSSPSPRQLFYEVRRFLEMKYDPFDVTDNCNSIEEKQNKLIKITSKSHRFDAYRNAPRYMIEYAIYLGITDLYYISKEIEKRFNFNYTCDKYSYTMSDELWEITKKIIGWEGEKE